MYVDSNQKMEYNGSISHLVSCLAACRKEFISRIKHEKGQVASEESFLGFVGSSTTKPTTKSIGTGTSRTTHWYGEQRGKRERTLVGISRRHYKRRTNSQLKHPRPPVWKSIMIGGKRIDI